MVQNDACNRSDGTDLTVGSAAIYETKFIPLSDIKVPAERMRSLRREVVDELADSFQEVGQLQPIVVRSVAGADHTYWLVWGEHRFEAAGKLGWDCIRASIVEGLDADRLELAKIDENLVRGELSPSERSAHQAKRKEIYERVHPETKAGGDRKSKSQNEILKEVAYVDEAAAKTGRSRATVAREVRRGEKIPNIADVGGTTLDKGVALDALAKLPADQQAPLIAKAKAGENVSAKLSEAVKAERQAKRKEKHKTKFAEDPAQNKVPPEDEQMATGEQILKAVSCIREHLGAWHLAHFLALVDGHWDDFGRALEREIMKLGEQREAAPGFGDDGEQGKSLSQQAVGRAASSGIGTDVHQ